MKKKGINVSISPEAHELMIKKAFIAKPRQNLREYVNIINNLPMDK